jgi:hypothetical protein
MVVDDKPTFSPPAYAEHAANMESPSSGQPEAQRPRYVIVVERDQPDLWRHLRQSLRGLEGVDLVLDRRRGGRWRWARSWEYQERGADRRRASDDVETRLSHHSVVVVHPATGAPMKAKT